MGSSRLVVAHQQLVDALAAARAAESGVSGAELVSSVRLRRQVHTQLEHDLLGVIARLDRDGVFASLGMHAGPAVAELWGCPRQEAGRMVRVASLVFPTVSLTGQVLEPKLPDTAKRFASWEITTAHVQVIATVLASPSAQRLAPHDWAFAETALANWAPAETPARLKDRGRELLEDLDQDGAEPELDDQANELRLTKNADGVGGRIKGELDSATFDALSQTLDGLRKPYADERKSLAQRNADALGELCENALDDGTLPETSGEKPHLNVTLSYETLKKGLKGANLNATGLRIGPREIRRLACTAGLIPFVLGGMSEPLDVGREHRHATPAQRRALAIRDQGCAHPGCTTPAHRCQAHHIDHWITHGPTNLNNLVLLCRTHHRMAHTSGWTVRIHHGQPEFIPPRWIDPDQTPRRRHHVMHC